MLEELEEKADLFFSKSMERSRETVAWITVNPLEWNGTGIEAEQFLDALRMFYVLTPNIIP